MCKVSTGCLDMLGASGLGFEFEGTFSLGHQGVEEDNVQGENWVSSCGGGTDLGLRG